MPAQARKRRQRDQGLKCRHHGASMSCRQRLCSLCCEVSGQPCAFHAPGSHSRSSTAGVPQQRSSSTSSGTSSRDSKGRLQTVESAANKQQPSSQLLAGARAVLSVLWLCWRAVWAPFRLTKSAVGAIVWFILPSLSAAAAEADAAASLKAQQAPSLTSMYRAARRIHQLDPQATTFDIIARVTAEFQGSAEEQQEQNIGMQLLACLLVLLSLPFQLAHLDFSYFVPVAVLTLCQLVAVQIVALNTVALAQHCTLRQLLSSWATLRITAVQLQLCWLFMLLVNGASGVTLLWVHRSGFLAANPHAESYWQNRTSAAVCWALHAGLHSGMSLLSLQSLPTSPSSVGPVQGMWEPFIRDMSRLCLLPAAVSEHTRTLNAFFWVWWFIVRKFASVCIAHILVPYLPNATLQSMGAAFVTVPEWMVVLPFWVMLQLHARRLLNRQHVAALCYRVGCQSWQRLSVLASGTVVAATTVHRAIASIVLACRTTVGAVGKHCKESIAGRMQSETAAVPSKQGLCPAGPGVAGHSECVVCLDARRSVALLPCGHVVLCSSCFARLHKRAQPLVGKGRLCCPVCRSEVHGHVDGLIVP